MIVGRHDGRGTVTGAAASSRRGGPREDAMRARRPGIAGGVPASRSDASTMGLPARAAGRGGRGRARSAADAARRGGSDPGLWRPRVGKRVGRREGRRGRAGAAGGGGRRGPARGGRVVGGGGWGGSAWRLLARARGVAAAERRSARRGLRRVAGGVGLGGGGVGGGGAAAICDLNQGPGCAFSRVRAPGPQYLPHSVQRRCRKAAHLAPPDQHDKAARCTGARERPADRRVAGAGICAGDRCIHCRQRRVAAQHPRRDNRSRADAAAVRALVTQRA